MHPVRKQRLIAVLAIVFGVAIAVSLVFLALGENLDHFYSPSDLAEGKAHPGQKIRVGGLVVDGSVNRNSDSLKVNFVITDTAKKTTVEYEGILPDLFKEGQGIIAIGRLTNEGIVVADQVLAKHDEKYMPPEVKESIERAGHPAGKG